MTAAPRETIRLKSWKDYVRRLLKRRRELRREALLDMTDADRQALFKMPKFSIQQEAPDDGKRR